MRAVAQAVAVVFVMAVLQGALLADPPEEKPTAPPTLAEEKERLKTLKEAEFRKLKAVISSDAEYDKKLSALREIASLATAEAVDLLSTLYDNPLKEDSESEQALLVELLGTTGSSAAGPTLLKAVQHPGKDGKVRLAAAGAIVRVMGKDAAAQLKKLTEDKVDAVKNRAWTELLKQQDLNAMRHVFKMLEGKEKLTALAMIKEAHFTEAAKEVAGIARETDFSKGPNEKILKLKALETALDLGHKESVSIAIELVEGVKKEQAEVLEVTSPWTMLNYYCAENFDHDMKKWQEWWDSKGKDIPLFSRYADSTALTGITEAVAKYIRESKFEPGLDYSVVYLWETHLTKDFSTIDDSIRVYRSIEIHLLELNRKSWRVHLNWTNSRKAFVSVGSHQRSCPYYIELSQADGRWTVTKIDGKPVKAP